MPVAHQQKIDNAGKKEADEPGVVIKPSDRREDKADQGKGDTSS